MIVKFYVRKVKKDMDIVLIALMLVLYVTIKNNVHVMAIIKIAKSNKIWKKPSPNTS